MSTNRTIIVFQILKINVSLVQIIVFLLVFNENSVAVLKPQSPEPSFLWTNFKLIKQFLLSGDLPKVTCNTTQLT